MAPLIRDVGELPYLVALRGLYAAGILLPEAHDRAIGTSPVAAIRSRLSQATPRLQQGEGFAKSLAAEGALGTESLELITVGETAGDLEDSLNRAAVRRREEFRRRFRRIAKVVGSVVYALAVLLVAYVVVSFYSGYLRGIYGR